MKKTLVALAIVASFNVFAQDATSSSNGTSVSNSTSSPTITSGNSSSNGTASSMSQSNPNNANAQQVIFNTSSGGASTMDSTSNNTNHTTMDGTTTQRLEGGTNSTVRNINEGTSTQRVEYSGTQTVKNVPGIQMSGPASGPCTGASGGVGLAGPGWGFGLNGSGVMDDCRIRENVRVLGMAMQSMDGNANPQQRGELTELFMDAARGLAAYNRQVLDGAIKQDRK